MSTEFLAHRVNDGFDPGEFDSPDPRNPFLTRAYIDSRLASGWEAWWFQVLDAGDSGTGLGCPAFLKRGRASRGLEIPSMPDTSGHPDFWPGLRQFCNREGVTDLGLNSFGSDSVSIPDIGTKLIRRQREEYVVDLTEEPAIEQLSKNHRRNVRKAERSSLKVVASRDVEAAHRHAMLVGDSTERRRGRGEDISGQPQDSVFTRLLDSGLACFYQAEEGNEAVSSILLLMAEKGVYYHSAGTSPEGMALGASPFLIHNISLELHGRGFEAFNLGGADASQPGLVRFKSGFNARRIELEAVNCSLQGKFRRGVLAAVNGLHGSLSGVMKGVGSKSERRAEASEASGNSASG